MVMLNGHDVRAGEKAVDETAVAASIQSPPESAQQIATADGAFMFWLAAAADGLIPWGQAPKARDQQLRAFIPTESYFLSALGTVCARNAGFSWTLEGGEQSVETMQDMLINSDLGLGWETFIIKLSMDLYTQDSGSFVELVRADGANAGPDSPVINVAHLDALRCFPTGNVEEPVIYLDRVGAYHKLKAHQVWQLTELPSAVETPIGGPLFTLQYCALSRMMKAAQVIKNIFVYEDEKTGGRFAREVHLLRGISVDKVRDALVKAQAEAQATGLARYMQAPMVGSSDVDADVGHDTIPLAGMTENFNRKEMLESYITIMALAFNGDYQDFAPLPGGGLGTSNQSEILHMKSRGKGPALFQKMITHFMNFSGVLPRGVTFKYTEQDLAAEKDQAELSSARATERATRITSTEIDAEAARQLAIDSGDLPQEVYDDLIKREEEKKAEQEKAAAEMKDAQGAFMQAAADQQAAAAAAAPPGNTNVTRGDEGGDRSPSARPGGGKTSRIATDSTRGSKEVAPDRLELEGAMADEFETILSEGARRLMRRLPMPTEPEEGAKGWFGAANRIRRRITARDSEGRAMESIEERIV